MKTFLALLAAVALQNCWADESSNELDRKIVSLLVEKSEVVVLCHKDTSGNVGMDPRLKERYGLKDTGSGFGLPVKETIIGPAITEKTILFFYHRKSQDEPFYLPQGDYLLFLKQDAQKRWVLVGDFMGIQLFTKGLDALVKDVQSKK